MDQRQIRRATPYSLTGRTTNSKMARMIRTQEQDSSSEESSLRSDSSTLNKGSIDSAFANSSLHPSTINLTQPSQWESIWICKEAWKRQYLWDSEVRICSCSFHPWHTKLDVLCCPKPTIFDQNGHQTVQLTSFTPQIWLLGDNQIQCCNNERMSKCSLSKHLFTESSDSPLSWAQFGLPSCSPHLHLNPIPAPYWWLLSQRLYCCQYTLHAWLSRTLTNGWTRLSIVEC